jgi:hypothetical protein
MTSVWFLSGDVSFDYLVQMVSARFLHCKALFFSFQILFVRTESITAAYIKAEGIKGLTRRMIVEEFVNLS